MRAKFKGDSGVVFREAKWICVSFVGGSRVQREFKSTYLFLTEDIMHMPKTFEH